MARNWFERFFSLHLVGVHKNGPPVSAFSKRFVGTGHTEEGGGRGDEGTLPSAQGP